MEVVIQSTLSSAPGQLTLPTDSDATVDSLISAFCVEKGIQRHKEYILNNKYQEQLDSTKRLAYYEIENGDILYIGLRVIEEKWLCGCNQWWLLATVALLIGGIGIIAITTLYVREPAPNFSYGVVIDAGSSSSRIYVYTWEGEKVNSTAVARQESYCRAEGPGIAAYEDDPYSAGDSLVDCLNNAETVVPASKTPLTNQYLGATAGMRILSASDPVASQQVLESVRDTMSSYPFYLGDRLNDVRILEGIEEGAFGWVTANYVSGIFSDSSFLSFLGVSAVHETYGALDLGGASTQITFVPKDPSSIEPENHELLLLYGGPYEVYTHSYLCYGSDEARRQMMANLVKNQNYSVNITNPCLPVGYQTTRSHDNIFQVPCTKDVDTLRDSSKNYTFSGSGDGAGCLAQIKLIFDFTPGCSRPPCAFNNVSQPAINGKFYAFSGYYTTPSWFNLTDKDSFSLNEFENATSNYCNMTWEEVLQVPHNSSSFPYLTDYCFDGHYIETILTEGYGFSETTWDSIIFRDEINGNKLGWSLGFMLNTSNTLPVLYPEKSITTSTFTILFLVFLAFLAVSLSFGCYAVRSRRRPLQSFGSPSRGSSGYGAV